MAVLSVLIAGFLLWGCESWVVRIPSHIQSLRGSCLVIPCSYSYEDYPPQDPDRVVWYQYVSRGYPLVFDNTRGREVIQKFKGKTSRVRSGKRDCSLQIQPVANDHHMEKIYPWVDPDHVGYRTYKFYESTVTIHVHDKAEKPVIEFFGDLTVGQLLAVRCSVVHSCSSFPPTLTLSIKPQEKRLTHDSLSDGSTRTTLAAKFLVDTDHQKVSCSVRHSGGLQAEATESFQAKCSYQPLRISSQMFLEGKASQVTCTAEYTCQKNTPTFSWNYREMPARSEVTPVAAGHWRALSTLTFTAAAKDQDRPLTCTARFTGGHRQEESTTIQVKRSIRSRDWSFSTPGSITALQGSCVDVPCTFSYQTPATQPRGLSVRWYLFQSSNKHKALDNTFGKTKVLGSVDQGNCSLHVERLMMAHHQNRLFPWISTTAITSYHDHLLYTETSQLLVTGTAQRPQVKIDGIPRVGEELKVSCSVRHSCPTTPPRLTIHLGPGSRDQGPGSRSRGLALSAERVSHTEVSYGEWEMTAEHTWSVREEDESLICAASHPGGQTATTDFRVKVECPCDDVLMAPPLGELMEGVVEHVTCSVSYKCKKVTPSITWSHGDTQSTMTTLTVSQDTYTTTSNLTFVPSLDDNGKLLTCAAQFTSGVNSEASTKLLVKKYMKRLVDMDSIDNHSQLLAADVFPRVPALTGSCVVIPCTFQPQGDATADLQAVWYSQSGGHVYHDGQSKVLDHFKGRTKILGDVSKKNCTLEIDNIKSFDNGPFCFRAERGNDKYRFSNSCVFIIMQVSPERPLMSAVPREVDAGSEVNVTCSVKHTCPSQPPVLTWSNHTTSTVTLHIWRGEGLWETSSTASLLPELGDGPKVLSCTATFWGGKAQTTSAQITVKGSLLFQVRESLPVSIPALAVGVILVLLVVVCSVQLWRKRRWSPVEGEVRETL